MHFECGRGLVLEAGAAAIIVSLRRYAVCSREAPPDVRERPRPVETPSCGLETEKK